MHIVYDSQNYHVIEYSGIGGYEVTNKSEHVCAYFHGGVPRQFGHAYGAAGMPARLPEQFNQQFRCSIDDFGLLVKARRGRDEPRNFQDLLHPVERSKGLIQAGQCLQDAQAGSLSGLFQIDIDADFSRHERFSPARQLPADEGEAFVHGHRRVFKRPSN